MQSNIHPKYYPDAQVTCTCGNKFHTGSTIKDISVDICSQCHPFFTGEMKFVDTQGRVEKFEALRQKASKLQSKLKTKKGDQSQSDGPEAKTLKEMMTEIAKDTKASQKTDKSNSKVSSTASKKSPKQ